MSKRQPALPLSPLGSLWLLGGLALVMAPHLLRLPAWLSACCLLALAWRLARDLREWPLPGMVVRLVLTLAGIGAVFAAFGTIIGREAGVALLAVMLTLKLVEMATLRDAVVVILLAYFLVAAGFLFDQSLLSGLYLVGTVVVLTAALMVINHPGSRPELTRYYLQRAGRLLLQALPLMAVLFVLFPRLQGSGWSLAPSTPSAHMGLSDSLTLGDVGNLSASREIAFRVEFQGPPPGGGLRYWRGPVLWHTDGRRWTLLTPAELHRAGPPHPFTPLGPPVDYTVSLPPESTGQWLPVLDLPVMVPDRAIATTDLQVMSARRGRSGEALRYQVRSYPQARWEGLAPPLRSEALRLPAGSNPRALALGREWAALEPRQRVAAAIRYFRDGPFRYTRHPPLLEGPDPVDQFLFETRQGFCEHYAASFTFLMRAAQLPARVVTGYEGGEFNTLGNYWIVRQSDAHAWSEVYLEGEGWVRVDPTSVIPPDRTDADVAGEETATVRNLGGETAWGRAAWRMATQGWDAVNFHWNRWVAGYSVDRQRELLGRMGLLAWGDAGLVVVLAGAAIMAVAAALRFGRRPRRQNDPALRLYQRYCRKLARAGITRRGNEGERAFAERVAREQPKWAEAATTITSLYLRARYSREGGSAVHPLKAAVAAFRP